MHGDPWEITVGDGPLVATAIHNGNAVRPEIRPLLAISEAERLREEDPYTGTWTAIGPNRIVGLRSRFEVDLNRPREKAVYLEPADCWGLRVWKTPPPAAIVDRSRSLYDAFYEEVAKTLQSLVHRFGHLVVYDLHSYNHRRLGPDAEPDDPASNPEVNVGTGTMDRRRWGPIVDRFLTDLRGFDFLGRRLDVRENVKFFGGQFARWIHGRFPSSVCVLSIEFKKFFMDEWSGELAAVQSDAIVQAIASTIDGVLEELQTR